jgi:hypothetical protein
MVDQLARLTLMSMLLIGVAACAMLGDPGAVGPCQLIVRAGQCCPPKDVILEPPYQTTLYKRPGGVEAPISISGSGWGSTRVDFAGPGKAVSSTLDGEQMGGEPVYFASAPGVWHFRLTSDTCTRAFDVEVRPAP